VNQNILKGPCIPRLQARRHPWRPGVTKNVGGGVGMARGVPPSTQQGEKQVCKNREGERGNFRLKKVE